MAWLFGVGHWPWFGQWHTGRVKTAEEGLGGGSVPPTQLSRRGRRCERAAPLGAEHSDETMNSGSNREPEASTVNAVQASQNSDVRAFVKEPAALPMLWDATFEQWRDNHTEPTHTIMSLYPSVWDREDVLPVGILYGGMDGVSKGIPCSHDGKYIITAVAIESTESVCHTHLLNNPPVPVLQMRITSAPETKAAVAKFIPCKNWYRLWLHGSNSCKGASTANMGGRGISAALNDTIFAIQVMRKFNAAIWALENASELHQFFKGK